MAGGKASIEPHRPFEGVSVLVVEDNSMVRDVLCTVLGEFGCKVSCARDTESALALILGAPVRLAIVDLGLPGRMNGEELARALRASGIFVVLMSADHERLEAAWRNAAHGCLAKPFRTKTLLGCVGRALIERNEAAPCGVFDGARLRPDLAGGLRRPLPPCLNACQYPSGEQP